MVGNTVLSDVMAFSPVCFILLWEPSLLENIVKKKTNSRLNTEASCKERTSWMMCIWPGIEIRNWKWNMAKCCVHKTDAK